jgi:riboflavin synthase
MFTGLVSGMGEVARLAPAARETRLTIRPLFPLSGLVRGESIAVNGACLSVETFDAASFTAYASAETLLRTNLGALMPGSRVNLERALALGDRMGGHMVSGHVDGLATLESVSPSGSSLVLRVRFPEEFSPQVIPKGSVALDGVSLTVNHCDAGALEVTIIPETQTTTTVATWKAGRLLNFETDLIGKYVQRMLAAWREQPTQGRLTMNFLREHGF